MKRRRVNLEAILADQDLRRELMVPTIQALQAREGIDTTRDQAERAYYVVTEADKATFFDLERFRGSKRSEPDRREEMFVRALVEQPKRIRFDVARRDFGSIETSPLAFRRVSLVAHLFRENKSFAQEAVAIEQGVASVNIRRYVRYWWEISSDTIAASQEERSRDRPWARFSKGGDYSRFYADVHLVMFVEDDWQAMRAEIDEKYPYLQGNVSLVIHPENHYFSAGLTWPRRTQRGFNVRFMPDGCVFADKGPAVFFSDAASLWAMLAIHNSHLVEFILQGITSFGSWEIGAVGRLPSPTTTQAQRQQIADLARSIHDAKATWDTCNETATRFDRPWIFRGEPIHLDVAARIDRLAEQESAAEARIQQLYGELNDEVYRLYGIPDTTRAIIEETLGERPPEILWPQMEKKSTEQKRMEHVWRLLSYVVKRVVEADEDGIVPFMAASGEAGLVDRVRAELATLFPDQDINQVEVDITNELRRTVKGYRRVESLREWLEDIFFDYHVSLYKKRPILWHIASRVGRGNCAFGTLVHYHEFDHDRLAKLRGSYLRNAIAHFRREAGLADQEGRTEDRQEWQAKLEEAQTLDRRLQWVQEGANGHPAPGDCRIRMPWKSDDELPVGWQPDLDDGVAVNILPLQTAGVLRIRKVV